MYILNGLGNLRKTAYPDNTEELKILLWKGDNIDAPDNSLFISYNQKSGSESITTYFDQTGKELRTVQNGIFGDKIYIDKVYDNSQRLWKTSMPYRPSTSPQWNTVAYDSYNRVAVRTNPDNTFINYSYSSNEVTMEVGSQSGTQSSTTKTNSLGETIESSDNLGISVFTKYFSSGLPKEIEIEGQALKTHFSYDIYGNRDTIWDPDAGVISSVYNTFGELVNQTDNAGNTTTYVYDISGRILSRTIGSHITYYTYDQSLKGVVSSVSDGYNSTTYSYNSLGQVLTETESLNDVSGTKNISKTFTYDQFGRPKTKSWSTGYQISYDYNPEGQLLKISDVSTTLWQAQSENSFGQINSYSLGSYNTSLGYNSFGELESVITPGIRSVNYGYDQFKNLTFRQDNLTNQKETFAYDNLNRLTGITYYKNQVHQSSADKTVYYDDFGNITGKTGIAQEGDIKYGEFDSAPHAITSISNPEGYLPLNQKILYTDFNKVLSLTDTLPNNSVRQVAFKYGIDKQRKKTTLTDGASTINKYFFADYEEIDDGTTVKKYHYIGTPNGLSAVYLIDGTSPGVLFFTFTDHLGSISEIVNTTTSSITKQSFDAWGNPRSVSNWPDSANYTLFANRGFTGHEHLEPFHIINMNGRLYDPVLGRFLSVDPFVQLENYPQNFNRYSYCLNNPLVYTDPSGELAWFVPVIIGALTGAELGGWISSRNPWPWKWETKDWYAAGAGAIAGAGIGLGVSMAIGAKGTGIMGIGQNFLRSGATKIGFDIISNALITANVNMASAALQGRSLGGVFNSGVVGLISGGIGGFSANRINGYSPLRTMSKEAIKWQNTITATLNGFGDRLVQSYDKGIRGRDMWLNGLRGASEGFYMAKSWGNNKNILNIEGRFLHNARTRTRYLSLAISQIGTSVPGLGSTIAYYHSLYLPFKWCDEMLWDYEPTEFELLMGALAVITSGASIVWDDFGNYLGGRNFKASYADIFDYLFFHNYPSIIKPLGH